MSINQFDPKTILALNFYVYMLLDPRDNIAFYIGKGKDNRVFQHLKCALDAKEEMNAKYDKILEIQNNGLEVKHVIIRHGIKDEVEAFQIEASLIDTLTYCGIGLSNIVGGHKSLQKGLMTTDEIIRLYNAEKLLNINNDCVIININKKYSRGGIGLPIYDATKETWTIDKNRLPNIKYVLSEYKGLIVEVFEVEEWYEKERGYTPKSQKFGQTKIGYGFNGKIANSDIRNLYINKSIQHTKKKGAASVIRFQI
jgi:hypothetical protein